MISNSLLYPELLHCKVAYLAQPLPGAYPHRCGAVRPRPHRDFDAEVGKQREVPQAVRGCYSSASPLESVITGCVEDQDFMS